VSTRTTDLSVASHSRLVYRNVIAALKAAFDSGYDRDRQLTGLRVTQEYPLRREDYPTLLVEYAPQRVVSAGVGHVEWFDDPRGHLRKWKHSRFEGTLNLRVYALSTLDRDLLADAVAELIRFGDLDPQLNRFYERMYPAGDDLPVLPGEDYSWGMFSQLMLDSDQLVAAGNSATVAPWQPEDVLVYSGGWSMNLHGAYYNSYPSVDWSRATRIVVEAYQTDQAGAELPFPGHAEVAWSPAARHEDAAAVVGQSGVSGGEEHLHPPAETVDALVVRGRGHASAAEVFLDA
jgi:hypothetical protein